MEDLQQNLNEKSTESIFATAVADAGSDNYLGNRKVVSSLLIMAISDVIDEIAKGASFASVQKFMEARSLAFAKIILGDDNKYIPIPNWNMRGHIDIFLARWVGSAETAPEAVIEQLIVTIVHELLVLGMAGDEGVLPEEILPSVQGKYYFYTGLLLGIDPPTQRALVFDSPEEEQTYVTENE